MKDEMVSKGKFSVCSLLVYKFYSTTKRILKRTVLLCTHSFCMFQLSFFALVSLMVTPSRQEVYLLTF